MQRLENAIGGRRVASSSSRTTPIFNPATGEQQAILPLSTKAEVDTAVAAAKTAAATWGSTPPMKRIKPMFRFKDLLEKNADEIARTHLARARQDPRRCAWRACARHRGRGLRLRHSATAEGRVHAQHRPRHRQLLGPPAARRRGRHHAVQLSGHGADVDVSCRSGLREHVHPEAVRARPVDLDAHLGSVPGGGLSGWCSECGARRQRGRRCAARSSGREGDQLRRLDADRGVRLFARHRLRASACRRSAAPRTT